VIETAAAGVHVFRSAEKTYRLLDSSHLKKLFVSEQIFF
jgi:hypothetical protein